MVLITAERKTITEMTELRIFASYVETRVCGFMCGTLWYFGMQVAVHFSNFR
jgi:hypothetical protein